MRHIPADALSRVSSYDWMGSLALLPLGFAIAGPVASVVGARTVLGVGAGGDVRDAAGGDDAAQHAARCRSAQPSRSPITSWKNRVANPRSRTSIRSSALCISG